jgi:hypothetical protein
MISPEKTNSSGSLKKILLCLMATCLILYSLLFGLNLVSAAQNATLTLSVSSTEVHQNQQITIRGDLSLPASGSINLQWGINGSGFVANYPYANMTNGIYSREFGFAGPGNWTFRLLWAGDQQVNSSTSNVISVNVLPGQASEEGTDYSIYIIAVVVIAAIAVIGALFYSRRKNKLQIQTSQ